MKAQCVFWTPSKPGQTLEFSVDVAAAGKYELLLVMTESWDYGNCQVELDGKPLGAVLSLCSPAVSAKIAETCRRLPGVAYWEPSWSGRIGVWNEKSACGLTAARFAHPDAQFVIYGETCDATQCERGEGDFDRFLTGDYDAVFVPREHVARAANAFSLTLGPGQEGCWIWPDLPADFYVWTRLSLSDALSW